MKTTLIIWSLHELVIMILLLQMSPIQMTFEYPQRFRVKDLKIDGSPLSSRSDAVTGVVLNDITSEGMALADDLLTNTEPRLFRKGIKLKNGSPATFSAVFAKSKPLTKDLSRYAHASLHATRLISRKMRLKKEEIVKDVIGLDMSGTKLKDLCPLKKNESLKDVCPKEMNKRYRTADGRCNNLLNPGYGQAMMPFYRFMSPDYADGIEAPRLGSGGQKLTAARKVSQGFAETRDNPSNKSTLMLMVWGQFMDHDLTHTAVSTGFNGSKIRCCGVHYNDRHPECYPLDVDVEDTHYSKYGLRCMEFVRSAPVPMENCPLGPRQQINQITSYLDASNVYGSSEEEFDDLRLKIQGKLKSTKLKNRKELLPPINKMNAADECRNHTDRLFCFRAGDARCNEQPSLTALHTIWQREHNRIASVLSQLNPHWDDEKTFQETRKIVGAEMQHIAYNEWLPLVLGQEMMDIFSLRVTKQGFSPKDHYDVGINPSISNVFATAAFRFGHSLVQDSITRYDKLHNKLHHTVPLHKELFNPITLHLFGSLDRIMFGAANERSQSSDEFVSSQLTNHLFEKKGSEEPGLDLFAMNIQRGREHGIQSFNRWRELCKLKQLESFEDLLHIMETSTVNKIRQLYSSVDDIDLFVGGLAERPLPNALVGPTFGCIIAQQFFNLKTGDRFWYENQGLPSSFTEDQLNELKKTSLSRVVCDNLDSIMNIQMRIFEPASERNRRVSCLGGQIRSIGLWPWQESSYIFEE